MTLTQELAQALRELLRAAENSDDTLYGRNVSSSYVERVAKAALARYDAETSRDPHCPQCNAVGLLYECVACSASNYPPTSRGSEGEVVALAWRLKDDGYGKPGEWQPMKQSEIFHDPNAEIVSLYAAPQPAQPCAEAWRQAIREWWEMGDEFLQQEMGYIEWIEARAREISKGA